MSWLSTFPDLNTVLDSWWGSSWQGIPYSGYASLASNFVVGTNPLYTVADFFATYPRFGGIPAALTANTAATLPTITVDSIAGLLPGQVIVGPGIPDGAVILSAVGLVVTLSLPATADATGAALLVYVAPLLPAVVLNMFVALASAALSQANWLESWPFGMALFIAHYATLWLRSESNVCGGAGQAALMGIERGIAVSKSVGDVSVTAQLVEGLEDWGAWAETTYGTQLATIAKMVGWGPIYIL